jgi:peptidoglycan-associated lipoprotein
MLPSLHRVVVFFAVGIALTLAGCGKKNHVAEAVPAPPPPPAPFASLAASPNDLQAGQAATLTWSTDNATQISISEIGAVAAKGTTIIRPKTSTTFVLTATGPGGSKEASARVTVTAPPVTARTTATDEELFSANVKDVFFAYDKSNVTANEESAVQQDARFLIAHPYMKLLISGHCDERGSEEYNLTLGDTRADTVRDQLERLGVQADRIRTISYGKEKPFCAEESESCWQLNRRAHFSLQP